MQQYFLQKHRVSGGGLVAAISASGGIRKTDWSVLTAKESQEASKGALGPNFGRILGFFFNECSTCQFVGVSKKKGSRLYAAGPPSCSQGKWTVPIDPVGRVDLEKVSVLASACVAPRGVGDVIDSMADDEVRAAISNLETRTNSHERVTKGRRSAVTERRC